MFKVLKSVVKKIKLRTLIILIILLIFNTYAWFIYSTRVSSGFTTHIVAWNVNFQAGEEDITSNVSFAVDRAYPGMEPYIQTVSVHNDGEINVALTYEIKSVRILGDVYTEDETTTSDDLLNMIKNDFPFSIDITSDTDTLNAGGGSGNFVITFTWDYESEATNDIIDTEWGERAYEYYAAHPDTASIELEIELTANQSSE